MPRFARLLAITLLALAAVIGLAHPASAAVKWGYGDQNPQMFSDARWASLPLKNTRRNVDWNVLRDPVKTATLDAWMAAARAAGAKPLLAIDRNWTIPREKKDKGPSLAQYNALIKGLKARYPWWNMLTPWNEANFQLQPTFKDPKKAWAFYQSAKKNCKGCTVTSPVVLTGTSGTYSKWLPTFLKLSKGKVKLWAVHNYGDLNRGNDKTYRAIASKLPGKIWITEAAGWVKFGDKFRYDEKRAAKAITHTFKFVKKNKKITGVWFYEWQGKANIDPETRWDSGVINADGTPRAGYTALVNGLKAAKAK